MGTRTRASEPSLVYYATYGFLVLHDPPPEPFELEVGLRSVYSKMKLSPLEYRLCIC